MNAIQGEFPRGALIYSPIGKKRVDAEGAPISGVKMAVSRGSAPLETAMGGVVGAVQINDHRLPGTGVGLKIEVHQGLREAVELRGPDAIFKAGQRGLGGQVRAAFRQSAHHVLEGRIPGRESRIVGILIAQGNGTEALPQKGCHLMGNPFPSAGIMQTGRQTVAYRISLVNLPEQQAAPSEVIRPPEKSATISLEKRLPK